MRFAFLFEKPAEFPPGFDNMKCYYVTKELIRRGEDVSWVQLSREGGRSRKDGISFEKLRVPSLRFVGPVAATLTVLVHCLTRRVRFVYIDGWLYLRHSPLRQLGTVLALRAAGIRVVVDQRDPYLDFEVARGAVVQGTLRYRLLSADERAMILVSSKVLLPSKAYADLLISEGAPPGKVAGFFRGIDLGLFNPSADGSEVRRRLGVEGKYVLGWFGMMHRHLRVREVLLPLARQVGALIPNGYMLIGGKGPLREDVVSAGESGPGDQFRYVGLVPYGQLPSYLAACDLILCPVSTEFRFSRHSNWLKIVEGLAVGRPVVATRTESTATDMSPLKGVVWTGQALEDFRTAVQRAYSARSDLRAEAMEQSGRLEDFSTRSTIQRIVDWISAAPR